MIAHALFVFSAGGLAGVCAFFTRTGLPHRLESRERETATRARAAAFLRRNRAPVYTSAGAIVLLGVIALMLLISLQARAG